MVIYACVLICVLVLSNFDQVAGGCDAYHAELVYKWIGVDYDWPNATMKTQYIDQGLYNRTNNALNGIKLFNGRVYLTIPRLKSGVAASLAVIKDDGTPSPPLSPYPNWDMHRFGDCGALQLVQSMEIDPNTGYMWILDTAFVPIGGVQVAIKCPAKLVVWDIVRDIEVMRYSFPVETVGVGLFYLNDLVLDYVNGNVAYVYMSDTLGKKLVAYDVAQNVSYAFRHASMNSDMDHKTVTINGESTNVAPLGINGIAMSADFKYVYYSAVSGVKTIQNSYLGSQESKCKRQYFLIQC